MPFFGIRILENTFLVLVWGLENAIFGILYKICIDKVRTNYTFFQNDIFYK